MARRKWSEARYKADKGAFLRLPLSVLQSQAYVKASPYARMLLIDLAMQYRGDNNGDLAVKGNRIFPGVVIQISPPG